MIGRHAPDAPDPRTGLDPDDLAQANARAALPVTMASPLTPGLALGLCGVMVLGALTFVSLSAGRQASAGQGVAVAPQPPNPLPPPSPQVRPLLPAAAPPPVVAAGPVSASATAGSTPVPPANVLPGGVRPDPSERFKAPALVVDLTRAAVPAAAVAAPAGQAGAPSATGDLAEDKFADRVAREEARPARAVRLASNSALVPQGTIVAGVLETAINSDLPGFVRAVVSRDVTGFDGNRVLIPAGSRLIGQYRSGLAAGQSRAFVIWTRMIRPDGVSVALGSPVTDTLGRAGLGGKVDSHFLKRFGSAVLLSVVQAGLGALGRNQTDVIVRSADDARSVAGIALQRDIAIPPTVRVAQGTPIRVFIARDLDFSGTDGE